MYNNTLDRVSAELPAPSIPSAFTIPRVTNAFSENGNLTDETYDKKVIRFLNEFEWYIEALKNQRVKGTGLESQTFE